MRWRPRSATSNCIAWSNKNISSSMVTPIRARHATPMASCWSMASRWTGLRSCRSDPQRKSPRLLLPSHPPLCLSKTFPPIDSAAILSTQVSAAVQPISPQACDGDRQQKDKQMPQDMGTTNVPTQSPADMPETTVICCDACLDIAGARDFYDRLQAALE